jgi:hypothetical protein
MNGNVFAKGLNSMACHAKMIVNMSYKSYYFIVSVWMFN